MPVSYNPNSTFGNEVYHIQSKAEESGCRILMSQGIQKNMNLPVTHDVQSELHEIMALLSAENYVVQELNQEGFQNRYYLYKRIKKWMLDISLRKAIIKKFSESLHLQFVKEKKRGVHGHDHLNKSGFIFCCPVCIEAVKIAHTTKHRKSGKGVQYYSVSNVVRHLQKLHSNTTSDERFVGNSKKMKRKRMMAQLSESSEAE